MAKNSINLSVVLPFLSSVTDYQSTYANTSNPRVLGVQINMGYWVPSHGYTRTPIRPGSISTVRFESAFSFFFSHSLSLTPPIVYIVLMSIIFILTRARERYRSARPPHPSRHFRPMTSLRGPYIFTMRTTQSVLHACCCFLITRFTSRTSSYLCPGAAECSTRLLQVPVLFYFPCRDDRDSKRIDKKQKKIRPVTPTVLR